MGCRSGSVAVPRGMGPLSIGHGKTPFRDPSETLLPSGGSVARNESLAAISKRCSVPPFLQGKPCGRAKQGRFVIFAFSLVLQCLGFPNYPDAGKNSTKNLTVTTLFCAHQMLVEARIWEQCPHMLAGEAQGKWQIDPSLPIYRKALSKEKQDFYPYRPLKPPPPGKKGKTCNPRIGESLRGKWKGANRTESLWEGNLPLRGSLRGRVFRGFQRSSQRQISLSEALSPVSPKRVAPWTFSKKRNKRNPQEMRKGKDRVALKDA